MKKLIIKPKFNIEEKVWCIYTDKNLSIPQINEVEINFITSYSNIDGTEILYTVIDVDTKVVYYQDIKEDMLFKTKDELVNYLIGSLEK